LLVQAVFQKLEVGQVLVRSFGSPKKCWLLMERRLPAQPEPNLF
jgi:hypothetical protein